MELSILDLEPAIELSEFPLVPFDLVLCFGVLYHLTDMLTAMRGLAAATKSGGTVIIETAYAQGVGCYAEYRPNFDGDPSNYWYPTRGCLAAMLDQAGFGAPEFFSDMGARLTLRAIRR